MRLALLKKVNKFNEASLKGKISKCFKNTYSLDTSLMHNFSKNNLIKPPVKFFCKKYNSENGNNKTSESKEDNKEFEYPDIVKLLFENNILKKKLPCFEVYSSQIEILNSPFDYYLAIIKLIKSARHRICISSLYLGLGKMEEFIVEELLKALRKYPDLKITLLFDFSRSSRIEEGKSSYHSFSRLITQTYPHSRNINIALFCNPNAKTIFNLNPTYNEIFGVLHSKLMISDNYTILTGANLSHSYFTNRQDRYFIIQDCEPFADYCEDYINSLVNVSQKFNAAGKLELPSYNVNPLKKKVEYTESILQQFKMFKYDNRVKIASGEKLEMKDYFDNLEKYNNNYRYRETTETLLEFNSNKKEFLKYLLEENNEKSHDMKFLKEIPDSDKDSKNEEENFKDTTNNKKVPMIKPMITQKVLIFPSFQFANINQLDDKEILTNLLSSNLFSRIRLSSGYINLPDFILNIWKEKDYAIQVVTSSPKANSFYKAGFWKKNIPHFYRRYEQLILKKLKDKTQTKTEEDQFRKSSFSLNEFHRNNWTFHSKGIWFYEKGKEFPTMTVIGSSNYNHRSFERDVESQFYIYSFCEKFSKKLHLEADDCFSDSKPVNLQDIKSDRDVKIKLRHKIFAKLFKKYL